MALLQSNSLTKTSNMRKYREIPNEDRYFKFFKAGQECGIKHIYNHLYTSVWRYAQQVMYNRFGMKYTDFDTSCIVNDAFMKVWVRRNDMESVFHIRMFVHKYLVNDCYNCIKKYQRSGGKHVAFVESYTNTYFLFNDPEEEAEQRRMAIVEQENFKLVENAIACLPQDKRLLVELRRLGFSDKRIALVINQSYQYVSREIRDALEELKITFKQNKRAADAAYRIRPLPVNNYEVRMNRLQADVLRLCYEKGYTFKQISGILGIDQPDLVKLHFMGKKALRRLTPLNGSKG